MQDTLYDSDNTDCFSVCDSVDESPEPSICSIDKESDAVFGILATSVLQVHMHCQFNPNETIHLTFLKSGEACAVYKHVHPRVVTRVVLCSFEPDML